MKLLLLALLFLLKPGIVQAQLVSSMWTDKDSYAEGEPIVVKIKLQNSGPDLITMFVGCGGIPGLEFDGVKLPLEACITYNHRYWFAPGSWREWTWVLRGEEYALPTTGGQHTVKISFPLIADSTTFEAPAAVGGRVDIGFTASTPADTLTSVFSRLNATVLWQTTFQSGSTRARIEISGLNVYDVINTYSNHPNIGSITLVQFLGIITSVETETISLPDSFTISPVYPNPVRGRAFIDLSVPSPQVVTVEVYDMLGRRAGSFIEQLVPAASDYSMDLPLGQLPSGSYIVRILGKTFVGSRQVVIQN